MSETYTRINWKDGENGGTPISADNLNLMDLGIEKAHQLIEELKENGVGGVTEEQLKNAVDAYFIKNPIQTVSDIFMRVSDGYIQFSTDNLTWKNVIAISELKGQTGKTAYEYAKDGGYTGTEEEFAKKLAQENPTREEFSQLSDTVNDMKENGTGTTVTGGSVKTILENIMAIIRAGDIAYTSDISEIANKTDVLIANLGVIDDGSGNGNGSDESGSDSEIKSSTQFYFTGANANNYGVVGQVIECKAGETYYWNGIFSTQTAQIHETTMLSALPNTDSLYDTSITIGDTLTANEDGGYTATNDGAMFFPAMFTKGSNVEGYIADNYAYLGKGSWIIQNTPF